MFPDQSELCYEGQMSTGHIIPGWDAHSEPPPSAAVGRPAPPEPLARRLQERTGFPREAFRSVARHARLDVRHRDELYQAIDRLPMKREHEVVLGISGLHTVSGFVEVFEELLASSSSALAGTPG